MGRSLAAQAQRCRMLAGCVMCSKSSVCNVFPQRTFFRQQLCPAPNNLRKVGPGLGPTLRNGRRLGPAKSKTSPKADTSVCAGPAWHVLALCGQRLVGRPQKACFTSRPLRNRARTGFVRRMQRARGRWRACVAKRCTELLHFVQRAGVKLASARRLCEQLCTKPVQQVWP